MSISVTPIAKPLIRVFGMAGTFHVGPDDAAGDAVRVRYFNTVASGNDTAAAGNSRKLLEELKPMRERAKVSALRDLSSLLQRELDDARVAHQLVPYLRGVRSKVGFFPGILVALVPKGFLEASASTAYPMADAPVDGPDGVVERYDNCWSIHRFKSDEGPISLGRLEIDPEKADLVVLDGQHRANAFRYVTKTFGEATGDTIYASFYESAGEMSSFNSELPVTILWFESDGSLDPKLLSRQLFVDVNTNAKPVSESRNILLDDRRNSSIVTGSAYKILATRGFDTNSFSLLHGGFDCEEGEQHPLALILPVHFRYALSYFAFGEDRYDQLNTSLKSEAWRTQKNYNRARSMMSGVTETDFVLANKGNKEAVNKLSAALSSGFAPELLGILEQFSLVQAHVQASADVEAYAVGGSSERREAWHKVFCGGEGLYGAFNRTKNPSTRASAYLTAIGEIQDAFVAKRAELFAGIVPADVKSAYQTFTSKAGLTGFLMAASVYCIPDGWDARTRFVAALNKLSKEQWVTVFAKYKPEVIRAIDPKLWPDIRNIILRVIQGVEPENSFYSASQLEDVNPDAKLLFADLKRRYEAFKISLPLEDRGSTRPDAQTIGVWRDEAIAHLKTTLAACGLEPLVNNDALEIFCVNRIDRMIPAEAAVGSADADEDEEEDYEEGDEAE